MGMDDNLWSSSDDKDLQDAISRVQTTRLGPPDYVLSGMQAAYVLVFNAGQHDEGVYTLQGRASDSHSYVLAFEETDDAERFAQLLQAEGFDLATPSIWDARQLTTFCSMGDFEVSLVPNGGMITPPAKNEYDRDAYDRLLNGGGSMDADGLDPIGASAVDPAQYAEERAFLERLFKQDGL